MYNMWSIMILWHLGNVRVDGLGFNVHSLGFKVYSLM
jgi:hypothetical protein